MANTDFGILLKTLLDKSGINSELEQVQKIVNKYSIDIMPELKTASLRNQMKAVSKEIANDFNKAFGTNLTGNDVFKAYENQAKQAEKAISNAQKKRLSEQEKYYNKIINNNKEIYALKEKKLYADKEESKELQRQITNLEKRNKRAYDSISQKGLGDTNWGLEVSSSEKELKNRLAIKEARLQDKANAQEQANVERQIAEYNKQELEYQKQRKQYEAEGIKQAQDEELLRQSMEYYEQEKYYQETRAKYLAEGKAQEEAYNAEVKETTEYYKQMAKEADKAYESRQRLAEVNAQKVNKIQLSTDITKIENDYKRFGIVSQEVENNLKELKIARENALKAEGTDRASAEIEKYNQKLAETKSSWKELQATQVSANQRTSQMTEMQEWMRKNKNATKLCGDQVQKLIQECQTCDKIRFDGIKNEFKELQVQAGKAGKLGNTLWGSIVEQGKSFIQWTSVSGLVMSVWHSFKQGATNVKKLDDSLVELSKVSDLSAQGLENITEEAFELGEQLSKTGTDVLDATTNFKRAGYDIADSMKYAEEALKTTNISENLKDAGEAASSLVNIMKGFQNETPEFASKINDAVNQVSNTEAVDFDNLIDGATRLSAVADQAGMSFEQMLGTLTGGYEILGNMEKVATGQITIFSRLQAIQLEGEEEVSTVAKLQETFSNATKGAVNIVDQTTGQLRNVYDILDDVAGVWDSLDKNTREALAIEAAGIRQKNVFLALMQNWKGVEDAVNSAKNSLGSADEENKKYLDSLSGRIENFESATQHLSKTLIDSDLLKFFVDLGTTGVKSVDKLVESLTPLGTLFAVGGGFLGAKELG